MRYLSRAIMLATLALSALAGCGKRSPTSPVVSADGGAADFYRVWDTSFVSGAYFFSTGGDPQNQLVSMDVDGSKMVAALFYDGTRYVDAGTVKFDQWPLIASGVDTLARRSVPVHGTPWYLYTSVPNIPALDATFDGVARHRFRVAGSASIGAFEDSVLSVMCPIIAAPIIGATVPRNQNLDVSWSDAGTDTSVRVFGFVVSDVDSSIGPGIGDARDPDGHATVAFEYSPLPAGSARLTLIRYRIVHRAVGATGVILKSEGVTHRALTLQ